MTTTLPRLELHATPRRGLRRCAALFAGLHLAATLLLAQGTGTISGSVSNTATGQNLEGAGVTLAPGGQSVLTAREGRKVLSSIPSSSSA